jgi:hypothetical protein
LIKFGNVHFYWYLSTNDSFGICWAVKLIYFYTGLNFEVKYCSPEQKVYIILNETCYVTPSRGAVYFPELRMSHDEHLICEKWLVYMKMLVFWVVAPCSLVEVYWCFRGTCCLWNVSKLLPDYMVLQPRRQPSSYLLLWKPQILPKRN